MYTKGRDEFLQEGREAGLKEGREEGRQLGLEQGIEQGIEQGLELGREQGIQKGLEQGVDKGFQDATVIFRRKMKIVTQIASKEQELGQHISPVDELVELSEEQLLRFLGKLIDGTESSNSKPDDMTE
jgi:flagellar biosynthesis/type III secretory pathway protein FliH